MKNLCDFPLNHQRELRIYGLRRSGNHAITNWIIAHLLDSGEEVSYLNDVNHNYPVGSDGLLYGSSLPSMKGRTPTPVVTNTGTLVMSFEENKAKAWALDILNTGKSFTPIWIKRDPKECWASRLGRKKHLLDKAGSADRKAQVWENNLWKQGKQGRFLMLKIWENMFPTPEEVVVINYEQWNDDKDYRDQIAKQLGFENKDLGKDQVPGWGFGSSFGQPPKKEERRYPALAEDPEMVEFVNELNKLPEEMQS